MTDAMNLQQMEKHLDAHHMSKTGYLESCRPLIIFAKETSSFLPLLPSIKALSYC